jgi:toxin YoeB
MTAAKRRGTAPAPSPAVVEEDRQAIVLREFREDLSWWIESNPRTALRVMRLIEETVRDPFTGAGKPEALRHRRPGEWSRRVTDVDRLIYIVRGAAIYFLAARSHYGQR